MAKDEETEALDALEKEAKEYDKVFGPVLWARVSNTDQNYAGRRDPAYSLGLPPRCLRRAGPPTRCARFGHQDPISQKVPPDPSGQNIQSSSPRSVRPPQESTDLAPRRSDTQPPR